MKQLDAAIPGRASPLAALPRRGSQAGAFMPIGCCSGISRPSQHSFQPPKRPFAVVRLRQRASLSAAKLCQAYYDFLVARATRQDADSDLFVSNDELIPYWLSYQSGCC